MKYTSLPWILGYAVVGGVAYYLIARKAYAAPAATARCPLPLDKGKLNSWLESNDLFGFFSKTCPPPSGYAALAKAVPEVNSAPAGVSLVGVCEDSGNFWFYAGPGSAPVKRDDLRESYCKTSGAAYGVDLASMFMI